MNILGVRVNNFSVSEIKEKISDILDGVPQQKFVTTLNPEILLKACQDQDYKNILNSADLNICDGIGIKFASCLKSSSLRGRLAGADLADFLLKKANQRKMTVLVVVAQNSLSLPSEIERSIGLKYPDLEPKAEYFSGSQDCLENAIIKSAEIVFVNFGAPFQEEFISKYRNKFPKAKLFVGVGGTFDFLTGKMKRAPKWMRTIGFEWLWRLLQEPKRFRRIWNAVIVFPLVIIFSPSACRNKER
jgi:N-acetylglucosaminyldiphosphoundecaprenol N-acetyl-beta-D-mannosaminyltransferase